MSASCGTYMVRKSRSQKENQKMRISFHHHHQQKNLKYRMKQRSIEINYHHFARGMQSTKPLEQVKIKWLIKYLTLQKKNLTTKKLTLQNIIFVGGIKKHNTLRDLSVLLKPLDYLREMFRTGMVQWLRDGLPNRIFEPKRKRKSIFEMNCANNQLKVFLGF